MFKCVECGCEYDIKPDYCDCGSNVFEEIKPAPNSKMNSNINSVQKFNPAKTLQNNNFVAGKIPNIQSRPIRIQRNETFEQQSSQFTRLKKSLDPISMIIFIFCIIMSFCTIFFIGNPEESSVSQPQPQTPQKPVENIPNVDTYWDNTVVTVKHVQQPVEQQQTTVQKDVDPITVKFEQWLNRPQTPIAQPQPSKPVQTPIVAKTQKPVSVVNSKPVQTVKPSPQSKPQTQNNSNALQSKKVQINPNNAKTNSPGAPNDLLTRVQNMQSNNYTHNNSATTTRKPVTQATISTTTSSSVAQRTKTSVASDAQTKQSTTQTPPTIRTTPIKPVKTQAQLNQELNSYKISLRNNIGKKINFLNVVGDGSCAITFKVDSSGRLTNRSFSSQSSNVTLNDAVYNAMMSTPSFNPPPEGYKNQTMTLRVKIYDGNYEVTLN